MLTFHCRAVGNQGWQYNCHPNEVTADHHVTSPMEISLGAYSVGTTGSGVSRAWGVSSIQMISEAFAPVMPDT